MTDLNIKLTRPKSKSWSKSFPSIIYQQIEFDSTLEPISLQTRLNTRTNITKNKGFLAFAKTKLLYYIIYGYVCLYYRKTENNMVYIKIIIFSDDNT